jgi:hypothetical protein
VSRPLPPLGTSFPVDDGTGTRCTCCGSVRDRLFGGWFCAYCVALVETETRPTSALRGAA